MNNDIVILVLGSNDRSALSFFRSVGEMYRVELAFWENRLPVNYSKFLSNEHSVILPRFRTIG